MSMQSLIEIFAEALEVDPSVVKLDSKISDYPEWSSLAWLTIMSMVDEKLNVQLSAPEIRSFVTVRDVAEAVLKKVGALQS
jgi:acyl carrier protein